MIDFLKEYQNPNEDRLNFGLMNRDYDDDLIEHIVASCKSLEVLKHVEFAGYDYISDEKQIDLNTYMTTRRKSKKKVDTKYMYLQDSRYVELRLKFKLNCKGEKAIIEKPLLIPVPDENGYYTIKGKKYFLLYQLVDASTYTTRQNLTLKSLMPVSIKRNVKEFKDSTGELHTAPTYMIMIFKKPVDILLFYFAKTGVKKTLEYFSVNTIMKFVSEERDTDNNIYFPISSKILLEVNKQFFNKYQYVQSIAFMILSIVTNRLSFDLLEDKTYWVERIGSLNATNAYNYYEKGLNTLTFFDRMLDETTKKILKLHDPNKKNIYSVVRWMIQNYNELRKKDNLDLTNKRLRCNEYIASLLTKEFSQRVNRIISLGNKVTIDKVKEIFKFPGMVIMEQLYKSGLLRFDDKINDMDFYSKYRFTLKGPNALGGKNDNNISVKYRGIHPSYIGIIDINVCGTSDPGSSGVITPFAATDGLYFDASYESEDAIFEMEKEAHAYYKKANEDKMIVDIFDRCETISDLFDMESRMKDVMTGMTIREYEKQNSDKMYIRLNIGSEDDGI
jgi:hypothetical protein